MKFDFPMNSPKIIKVVGVGGGGGNAVNHMYREGIYDVTFAACNTDAQALGNLQVPVKQQMGDGLGAGGDPQKGNAIAEEHVEDIKNLLNDGTKMVFITAGMGGGTGTGAAPVIARVAKEMEILTVGIVTIPFLHELDVRIIQALDGVEEMAKHTDALLVINNQRLCEIYADFTLENAFAKADDTLSTAARGIAEIITRPGLINMDFADVKATLKNGGVAIMSTGYGEGENRVTKAIEDALRSPLLNNNDVFNAKKVLLNLSYGEDAALMMLELNEISEFMSKFSEGVEALWGVIKDETLDDKVKITLLATGFGVKNALNIPPPKTIKPKPPKPEPAGNKKRIEDAYGLNREEKSRHIYLFDPEDVSNDILIDEIENSPAWLRSKNKLNEIKGKSGQCGQKDNKQAGREPGANGVITFS